MKYLIILCFILNPTLVFADTSVIYLPKGSPATYDGYLFTTVKTLEVKTKLLDLDDLKAENDSYQRSINLYKKNQDIYQQENSILLDQNAKMATQLSSSSSLSVYEKFGYFALGVLVTGLSFKLAQAAIRN